MTIAVNNQILFGDLIQSVSATIISLIGNLSGRDTVSTRFLAGAVVRNIDLVTVYGVSQGPVSFSVTTPNTGLPGNGQSPQQNAPTGPLVLTSTINTELQQFLEARNQWQRLDTTLTQRSLLSFFNTLAVFVEAKLKVYTAGLSPQTDRKIFYWPIGSVTFRDILIDTPVTGNNVPTPISNDVNRLLSDLSLTVATTARVVNMQYVITGVSCSSSSCSSSSSSSIFIAHMNLN